MQWQLLPGTRGEIERERGLVPNGVTTQLTAGKCAKIHNKLGKVENEQQQLNLKLISLPSIYFIDKLFQVN